MFIDREIVRITDLPKKNWQDKLIGNRLPIIL